MVLGGKCITENAYVAKEGKISMPKSTQCICVLDPR